MPGGEQPRRFGRWDFIEITDPGDVARTPSAPSSPPDADPDAADPGRSACTDGAPARRSRTGPDPVEAVRHDDKRANIPTDELRRLRRPDDDATPKRRSTRATPSLDPQLVWRGKDEQDGRDLDVPAVPIYIQEKIHPQAIIENLRDTAERRRAGARADPVRRLQRHRRSRSSSTSTSTSNWSNRLILGDSLLVMTSLAEKEGLAGKVQMIYIDPPYGIKFGSNWQVTTRKRDVKDGKATDVTRQPEQIRAFRDTWELGIHSYLAYLRDRLLVARDLLTETGSVFVQIGDENVHLVRALLDEVFGSENFVSLITFKKTSSRSCDGRTCSPA